jgi:hypothetical protein
MGIRIFNILPSYVKILYNNSKQLKLALKDYLYSHSFCTLEEYYSYCTNQDLVNIMVQYFV